MSDYFDIRTAYLLLGVLSLAAALGVHATLRQRRRARHQTWVGAGLAFGLALVMIAARGHVPEVVTYDLSHLGLVAAVLLYVSALGAEFGRGWSIRTMALVLVTSAVLYGTLTRIDRGLGLSYNVVVMLGGAVLITVTAVRTWWHTRQAVVLAIAAGFGTLVVSLIIRLLSLAPSPGAGGAFEPGLAQMLMMVAGLLAVILGNLGYLGLQFLRMAADQVATAQRAAVEAERARQTQARELALRGLLEERNQLIQRIARSEAASDLALFATALPHELSQPLCASMLSLDSLKATLERQGDPGLLPVVRAIESSNARVLDLLQQLRILLQAQETSDREPVDLRALVQRTLPILEGSFREAQVRLTTDLPPGPADVLASATQLQQLLLILCTQALDECRRLPADPPGSQVQVSLEVDPRQVRLRVDDSGQRTGAQLRQQMQAAVTHTGGGRMGLGLAVAQRVAQAHHGQLQIRESWLGGASFILSLPSAQDARETAASALAITPPPRHTSPS